MNIQEKIKIMKERIAELEEILTKLEGQIKIDLSLMEEGDTYWYINTYGGIWHETWEGDIAERDMLEIGNIYKNEEQAEFAVEKMKVEAELRKFSRSPNVSGVHWFIVCADSEEVYTLYTTQEISQGTIYFESKKVAQQAIQSVGEERIKKYIFEVED